MATSKKKISKIVIPKKVIVKKGGLIQAKKPLVILEEEILFRVAGEKQKDHSLSWEIFKKIGDSTQALINKLAKYSTLELNFSPSDLNLVVTGFYAGSSIPAMRISNDKASLFDKKPFLRALNTNFSEILENVNDGNYQAIADRYNTPEVKNDIIDAVYNLTNAAGTTPFQIVHRSPNDPTKFLPIAKVRYMKIVQRDALKVEVPSITTNALATEIEAVGQMILKVSQKGRKSTKVKQLYTGKTTALSLRFDSIETQKRIYLLKGEQYFSFVEDPKKHWVSIENIILDIYAHGETMALAQEDLFDQFDYTYQRLNQIPDNQLSAHLLDAKNYINMIVRTVKDK